MRPKDADILVAKALSLIWVYNIAQTGLLNYLGSL